MEIFPDHWETGETEEVAMRRELQEELGWQPQNLNFLRSLIVKGNRRIHTHKCQLDVGLQTRSLQEVQEISAFTSEKITQNSLFSQRGKQFYPITPISLKVFKYFTINRY
ncbi:MAG: NUDIX domain-containing protein [Bacteroidetes bacterium]|nr:NUDIX domain-containing protein [Bacteroidota bacterium]